MLGLQSPPECSPGQNSSVAPTTVRLFTETLEESRSRRQIREEGEKENKSEERVENDIPEENETRDNAGTHTNTEGCRQTHR